MSSRAIASHFDVTWPAISQNLRVLEIVRPERLVFTWGWEQCDGLPEGMKVEPGKTTVEVTFTRDGDGTILRLRHDGLPTDAAVQFHSAGWNLTIDRLVAVSEGRDPGPYPYQDV